MGPTTKKSNDKTLEPLFHYCSTSTFFSIVSHRSIWLSSLRQSNDSLEGKVAFQALMSLAAKDSDLNFDERQRLQSGLNFNETLFDGLGFCLSRQGDLLSQWRGYANDATGVSIGFSEGYLRAYCEKLKDKALPIRMTLNKIEYDSNKHIDLVKETYEAIKKLVKAGAFNYASGLRIGLLDLRTDEELENQKSEVDKKSIAAGIMLLQLLPKLFSMKSDAFKEEEEFRLISNMLNPSRLDINGQCQFRYARNSIIPYRSVPLEDLGTPIIEKVILGPKQETPIDVVNAFLIEHDFKNVTIEKSSASYR